MFALELKVVDEGLLDLAFDLCVGVWVCGCMGECGWVCRVFSSSDVNVCECQKKKEMTRENTHTHTYTHTYIHTETYTDIHIRIL